jgi:hypothetical protein
MRRLIIFSLIGLVAVGIVFYVAQTKRDNIITEAPKFSPNPETQVSGIKKASQVTQDLPIKITVDKNPVNLWWPQKILVETKPDSEVRLQVTYPNGSINNNGTTVGHADKNGRFEIKWNIKGTEKTTLGLVRVEVIAISGHQQGKATTEFDIIKAK